MSDGQTEAMVASQLLNKDDPTLLTWREIKDSYGSCTNFMQCNGLKPWNPEDIETAICISRTFKTQGGDEYYEEDD